MAEPFKQRPRRKSARQTSNPVDTGSIDPRPVTGYSAEVLTTNTLQITLDQPCIVRQPLWCTVDSFTGEVKKADSVTVLSPTQFVLHFASTIKDTEGFTFVPYMDPQVQNFSGGFVSPGAQWFRNAA